VEASLEDAEVDIVQKAGYAFLIKRNSFINLETLTLGLIAQREVKLVQNCH